MDEDLVWLPRTDITLADARSQFTALHFAKESLTPVERQVLHLAEGLLRLVDEQREQGGRR